MAQQSIAMQHSDKPHVIIIGAGLSGCLAAILLAQQGCAVDVYDYRADMRKQCPGDQKRQRSINLALSTRGITALRYAGIADQIIELGVPMHGRCIHPATVQRDNLQFQRYGQKDQYLLSVSRAELNKALLDACCKAREITLHFKSKCVDVDLRAASVALQQIADDGTDDGTEPFTVHADLILGADGSYSKVRAAMAREDRFNFSQSYISAAYKELTMSCSTASPHGSGEAPLPVEWLHIWPRHRFMLIALPNDSQSFTCTLFMDKEEIDALKEPAQVEHFFKTNFPDAVQLMPSLAEDFLHNPSPSLVTVRCNPYHFNGTALLIGDAAHAIVPFYGQGCNAAFEDCRILAETVQKYGPSSIRDAVVSFSNSRKENADAIADLAIDHYEDMSSRTIKPFFVLRRKLEIFANRLFPQSFMPLYSMISFSNIPYAEAVRRARNQDKTIERSLSVMGVASLSALALAVSRMAWKKSICNQPAAG